MFLYTEVLQCCVFCLLLSLDYFVLHFPWILRTILQNTTNMLLPFVSNQELQRTQSTGRSFLDSFCIWWRPLQRAPLAHTTCFSIETPTSNGKPVCNTCCNTFLYWTIGAGRLDNPYNRNYIKFTFHHIPVPEDANASILCKNLMS